jgi:hypothetical protein
MTSTEMNPNRSRLEDRLADYAVKGVDAINDRLCEIEGEWTAGRMVKATTGLAIVVGFALTAMLDPIWMLLPAIAGAFLLQYLFFRQSPLTDIFHGLGFRSGHDIDAERLALRTLRGDFRHLPTVAEVEDRDAVTRMESEGGPAVELEEPRLAPREAAAQISAVAG